MLRISSHSSDCLALCLCLSAALFLYAQIILGKAENNKLFYRLFSFGNVNPKIRKCIACMSFFFLPFCTYGYIHSLKWFTISSAYTIVALTYKLIEIAVYKSHFIVAFYRSVFFSSGKSISSSLQPHLSHSCNLALPVTSTSSCGFPFGPKMIYSPSNLSKIVLDRYSWWNMKWYVIVAQGGIMLNPCVLSV